MTEEEIDGVGGHNEVVERVADEVTSLHKHRVALDESAVGKPIEQRIVVGSSLQAIPVGACGYRFQQAQIGQSVDRSRELDVKFIVDRALGLFEVERTVLLVEHTEQQVVRCKHSVHARHDGVDFAVELKYGVGGFALVARGDDNLVDKSHVLVARESVVAVHIFQSEEMIAARLHIADGELTVIVGSSDASERDGRESRVVEVLVNAHYYALHRFQVTCAEHNARHLKRIDAVAGGESESKVVERIALVVVLNSVGKVDAIGGVRQQRVAEFYRNAFAVSADDGHIFLCRRHHHLGGLVLELDILVEIDGNLAAAEVELVGFRVAAHIHGRSFVARSTRGTPDVGARHEHRSYQCQEDEICCIIICFHCSKKR